MSHQSTNSNRSENSQTVVNPTWNLEFHNASFEQMRQRLHIVMEDERREIIAGLEQFRRELEAQQRTNTGNLEILTTFDIFYSSVSSKSSECFLF